MIKIEVIGIGKGGCNSIDRIIGSGIVGVKFWAIDTDDRTIAATLTENRLQIGQELTRGLGTGGNPAIGKEAAAESKQEIATILEDSDLVFIVAGMGGGTGTGAAEIVAKMAREIGCLTVGVVTRPFTFEGRRRRQQADVGINNLLTRVDSAIVISSDRILSTISPEMPLSEVFSFSDDIICQGVQAILNPIAIPGMVNVDFVDIRAIMTDAGLALLGIGEGEGKLKAVDAAKAAISCSLLESSLETAKKVILNITGGTDISLHDVNAAAQPIYERIDPDANIVFGATIDEQLQGKVKVAIVATGFTHKV